MLLTEMFRNEVKNCKEYGMKNEAQFDVQYSTGFPNIDYLNGQCIHVEMKDRGIEYDYDSVGIVDGSINIVIGRSGCGKSTFIKQAGGNIIRPFSLGSIFEDSIEGGITRRRDEILTGMNADELNSKMIVRNAGISTETFYKSIKIIYDMKTQNIDEFKYDTGLFDSRGNRIFKLQPTVYILDSLAMLMPEKMTQEEELSGQMSTTAAAKMIATTLRRIAPLCKAANIIVFIVNHITHKVEINPMQHSKTSNIYLKQGEACPGGETPFYIANNILRLDDNTKLTEDKGIGISGNHVLITLVKSRTNRAGASTDMIFNQDIGFDVVYTLYNLLSDNNLIKGAGAYLYIDGHPEMKFAQKNFKSKVAESAEFRTIFLNTCATVLHNMLYKQEKSVTSECDMNTEINNELRTILTGYNNIPSDVA